jgi:hypothetical protein
LLIPVNKISIVRIFRWTCTNNIFLTGCMVHGFKLTYFSPTLHHFHGVVSFLLTTTTCRNRSVKQRWSGNAGSRRHITATWHHGHMLWGKPQQSILGVHTSSYSIPAIYPIYICMYGSVVSGVSRYITIYTYTYIQAVVIMKPQPQIKG